MSVIGVRCMLCLRWWGAMNRPAFEKELASEGVVARFCSKCAGHDDPQAEALIAAHEHQVAEEQVGLVAG